MSFKANIEDITSYGESELKRKAIEIAEYVVEKSNPYELVKSAIKLEGNTLDVEGKKFEFNKIYVVGIGKAAYSMAKAVEDVLGEFIECGVISTKYGYAGKKLEKIEIIESGHPVPDENSLKAAKKGLEVAEKVGNNDLLLLLISGGGSSLFVMPENEISLKDKIETYKILLKSGARIQEVNTVRKHISAVKGGKFVKRVKGKVVALIISDVVGDDLEAIASGISVRDPTTFKDAYEILKNYGVWSKIPESVKRHIEKGLKGEVEETLKENLNNVHNFLICSSSKVCEFASEKALELGFNAKIMSSVFEGEAKDCGIAIASIAFEIAKRGRPFEVPCALIFGGEMTVTFTSESKGKGGPNQEFALAFARKISGIEGVCALSMDSDGTDGPTDAAGGVVDGYTWSEIEKCGIDPFKCLMEHNSYKALKTGKSLLITGPTGTNVNSFVIVLVR